MNLDLLKEMIRRHEGLRLRPYYCSKNHKTLGYGWNLANELPEDIASYLRVNGEITRSQAERLLNISIDVALRQCWAIFPDFADYSERRQMALADFIFNVGIGTALKFRKAMAAVLEGQWSKAADEFQNSAWFSQVGNRSIEICEMIRNG